MVYHSEYVNSGPREHQNADEDGAQRPVHSVTPFVGVSLHAGSHKGLRKAPPESARLPQRVVALAWEEGEQRSLLTFPCLAHRS